MVDAFDPDDLNSARQFMVDRLRALLDQPKWEILDTEKGLGEIDRPYLLVNLRSVERGTTVAKAAHTLTFMVTLVVPGLDVGKAETALGNGLQNLLFQIDKIDRAVTWQRADKVIHAERYLAYEIPVTFKTQINQPEGAK